jgi:futalosine hydrolase
MKIAITAATDLELEQIKASIALRFSNENNFHISFYTTGVGILATTFALMKIIYADKPDLVVQVGIAGALEKSAKIGEVVVIKDEYLGDVGVEENGQFRDVFDLQLQEVNTNPFANRALPNTSIGKYNLLELPVLTGVTVNEVTTNRNRIKQLQEKYAMEIESMEGAALHYTCIKTNTPFIQIRAISNYIGERDKTKWSIKIALKNLQNVVLEYMNKLHNEISTGLVKEEKTKNDQH